MSDKEILGQELAKYANKDSSRHVTIELSMEKRKVAGVSAPQHQSSPSVRGEDDEGYKIQMPNIARYDPKPAYESLCISTLQNMLQFCAQACPVSTPFDI